MGCAWFYYYIHAVAFRFNYYFKCQFCELCKLIAIWKYFEEFKTWIVAYSICSHLKLFLKQPELMVLSLVTVFRRNHCSSFSTESKLIFFFFNWIACLEFLKLVKNSNWIKFEIFNWINLLVANHMIQYSKHRPLWNQKCLWYIRLF